MSKKTKQKSKERRKKEKAQRKATMQALYETYKKAGTNTKSKRNLKNSKVAAKSVTTISHPDGPCGNPGCKRCFEVKFRPFLVKGQPHNMPQWMWLRWSKLSKSEQKRAAR